MKKHPILILFFLIASLLIQDIKAQDQTKSGVSGRSPYELISSYYETQFNPFRKSNVYLGLAFSVQNSKLENTDYLIKQVLEGSRDKFSVLLKGGYYLGDYIMVGLNLSYSENEFRGVIFQSPDTIHSNSISRGFMITPNIRPSFPLTPNERLSFFTEIGLTYGRNHTLKRDITRLDEVDKSYETVNTFRVGISPGVTFFAMENFAFEVRFDVLGYSMTVADKSVNDGLKSHEVRHNVDFEINLLTLDLGLSYYFGAGKKR
ncbi:MAG: outer membrane beta-barrel protein [Draconibacterium sp.]